MRRDAIIASASLHVAIVALVFFGLPSLFRPAPIEDTGPVSVEVVTLTDKAPAPSPAAKPAPPQPKPPPPPPPQPQAAHPPPPPPPPDPVKAPEPETVPVPTPKPKPVEAPAPKPKPEPVKEAKVPPRPKEKPKPPAPKQTLTSLLKDIRKDLKPAPTKPANKPEPPKDLARDLVASLKPEEAPARPAQAPSALAQREASQIAEAVRSQITPCWAVPAGAKDARDMRIGIHITLNPDGTLRGVPTLEDSSRVGSDPVFRAFAESALRAIQNPRCSPLRLPPDRYATWSDMTIVFDPRELVGP